MAERRRRRTKAYKFTEYTHSFHGIAALIGGCISIVMLIVAFNLSLAARGEAPIYVGVIGAFAIIVSALSLIVAVIGLKTENTYTFFSKVAIVVGIISLVLWAFVVTIGLRA